MIESRVKTCKNSSCNVSAQWEKRGGGLLYKLSDSTVTSRYHEPLAKGKGRQGKDCNHL